MWVRTVEEIGDGNLLLRPSRGSTWGTRSGWLVRALCAGVLLVGVLLVGVLLVGALSGSLCFIASDKWVGTVNCSFGISHQLVNHTLQYPTISYFRLCVHGDPAC